MRLDDDFFGQARLVPGGRRVFSQNSSPKPGAEQAWKDAFKACAKNDAQGVKRALMECSGHVEPISARGTLRANACAKAVMALKADPAAWSRLRRGVGWTSGDPSLPDEQWMPYGVGILAYLWAANPDALARAAKLWRLEEASKPIVWSCPFLARPWEGRLLFEQGLQAEATRLIPQARREAHGADAGPVPQGPIPDMERQALIRIATETAKACALQMTRRVEFDAQDREQGKTVWENTSSNWGVDWAKSAFPLPYDLGVGEPTHPLDVNILSLAVEELVEEALDRSPQQGVDMARLLCLGLPHETQAGQRAWAKIDQHPQARRLPLPFGPFDWMRPAQLAGLPISDATLGAWLAGPGASWSAPGKWGYGDRLERVQPRWSIHGHNRDGSQEEPSHGLGQWTPLEWLLLDGRHAAARQACSLGAVLHPDFEQVLAKTKHPRGSELEAILAAVEACRLATSSRRPELQTAPKASRL